MTFAGNNSSNNHGNYNTGTTFGEKAGKTSEPKTLAQESVEEKDDGDSSCVNQMLDSVDMKDHGGDEGIFKGLLCNSGEVL